MTEEDKALFERVADIWEEAGGTASGFFYSWQAILSELTEREMARAKRDEEMQP